MFCFYFLFVCLKIIDKAMKLDLFTKTLYFDKRQRNKNILVTYDIVSLVLIIIQIV